MKTVFVLGAGASKPYGFPLGSELPNLFRQYAGQNGTRKKILSAGHTLAEVEQLTECLDYGPYSTIDELLTAKKRFRKLGGLLIAETIWKSEDKHSLFHKRDWMHVMFNVFKSKILNGDSLDVSFVTLNYDRSIECFLDKIPMLWCSDDEEELVRRHFDAVKVIHPHGYLGPIAGLPYGQAGRVSDDLIVSAGASIQIISDDMIGHGEYQMARNHLSDADTVAFLGFAYHQQIIDNLFDLVGEKTRVVGTSLGLQGERIEFMRCRFEGIELHDCTIDKMFHKIMQ